MFSTLVISLIAFAGIPLSFMSANKPHIKCPHCSRTFTQFDIKESRFCDEYYCPKCSYEFRRKF